MINHGEGGEKGREQKRSDEEDGQEGEGSRMRVGEVTWGGWMRGEGNERRGEEREKKGRIKNGWGKSALCDGEMQCSRAGGVVGGN